MSFLFKIPAIVSDGIILFLQGIIGFSWFFVIYRLVSLGNQLDFISLPSTFPNFPHFPSTLNTKRDWKSLGAHLIFCYCLLESIFSLYQIFLIGKSRKLPVFTQHPREFLRDILLRATGSGLGPKNIPTLKPTDDGSREYEAKIQPPSHHPTERLPFDHPAAVEYRQTFVIWFRNCQWKELHYDNVLEWLCCTLFNKTLDQARAEDKDTEENKIIPFLDELVLLQENKSGTMFPKGYNESLRHRVIKLTLDPLKVKLRPLIFYAFAWSSDWLVKRFMMSNGFEFRHTFAENYKQNYLVRIPKNWENLSGLVLYITILHWLSVSSWSKERPMVVLIQPHISMGMFDPSYLKPPNHVQVTENIRLAIEYWGFKKTGVDLLSHSNGTLVSGWVIKEFPNLVRRCCMLDPVCFGNFLYSKPKTGMEKVIRYSLGTELGISNYIHRYFDWPRALIFPHQIPFFKDPKRFLVVLGGKDSILTASRVYKYLIINGMKNAFPEKQLLSKSGSSESVIQSNRANTQERQNLIYNPATQKLEGGIFFDPNAAHGETFMPQNPYFKLLKAWMEEAPIIAAKY
ncbi:hypothetical protein PPACK8108_LOCUS11516 [Phakopsora pachyrhizi]|uniref:Uncharacterized protein n=1 Tax=Phakopsora pachyrhizi TaxID=170000 RepID=A0AAV0B2I5_PHAPC|nr:hypothetical protein PPACK8108_LOCUS11516 [Phakopsora pachyrhizi]